jgi:hypothetical protein
MSKTVKTPQPTHQMNRFMAGVFLFSGFTAEGGDVSPIFSQAASSL